MFLGDPDLLAADSSLNVRSVGYIGQVTSEPPPDPDRP